MGSVSNTVFLYTCFTCVLPFCTFRGRSLPNKDVKCLDLRLRVSTLSDVCLYRSTLVIPVKFLAGC